MRDINTSLIKTARGRTIMLQHNTCSPRPMTHQPRFRHQRYFPDYPPRFFFDGAEDKERWNPSTNSRESMSIRSGSSKGAGAEGSGHGGMDYIMNARLIQCIRHGLVPDMDVYDAAFWTAPPVE